MSNRFDKDRVADIVTACSRALEYTKNVSYDKFINNNIIQDAVIRNIEIIGESAKSISKEHKEKNSDIPWRNITGVRDRLIHEYFGVNLDIVWAVQ